jgi:acyl-coenzyme A thioesterase PaaI-like protein
MGMVDDIRAAGDGQHWNQFEQAWTALMSYRYLGKLTPVLDAGVEVETMPLRHDMRNATGGIMAAPMCIAAPEPYWLDTECIPAPVVMSYEILDSAHGVRQVVVEREVIHLGRTMGFSRSRVVDADDRSRVIAISTGTGVSLGVAPEGYVEVDNPPIDVVDHPAMPSLAEAFGATRTSPGVWHLPVIRPELASPHAALHLGPINVALEATVMDMACAAAGTDALQMESWTVMMVRPGVVGPFRATAAVVNPHAQRIAVEATLTDEGRDDRTIATVSAVLGRV